MTSSVQLDAPRVISVSADYPNLRVAALELLEEQFNAEREERVSDAERIAANAQFAAMLGRKQKSARTLSPGYYERAGYLFELAEILEAGFMLRLEDVHATEVPGVTAVLSARADFNRTHPVHSCGARNKAFEMRCRGCGAELRPAGGAR